MTKRRREEHGRTARCENRSNRSQVAIEGEVRPRGWVRDDSGTAYGAVWPVVGEVVFNTAIKKLLLFATSMLIAVLIMEVVARAVIEPVPERLEVIRLSASDYYQPDAELGWRPRPNITGSDDRFEATFRTNSRGLRSPEHEFLKQSDVTRIIALGDSFTWGAGVDDDEIYIRRLEGLLPRTEVVNLGVTAFNLQQSIAYFQREGTRYDGDIVLLGFCLNDIYRSKEAESSGLPYDPMIIASRSHDEAEQDGFRIKVFLARNSRLYKVVVDAVDAHKPLARLFVRLGLKDGLFGFDGLDTNLTPALAEYPFILEWSFERTEQELLRLREVAVEAGMRLVVAVIPSLQTVDPAALAASIAYTDYEDKDFDLEKPYRRLRDFAAKENLEIVIPVDAFRVHTAGQQSLYLTRDMHFNSDGHQIFAEAIASYLSEHPVELR